MICNYCISSKSRHTSKSHRPQNLATSFSKLIPINAALEYRRMVKDCQLIHVYAHALYSTAHMKGKRYTRFPAEDTWGTRRLTRHFMHDYYEAHGLHTTRVWKINTCAVN